MQAFIAIESGPHNINVRVQAEVSTLWTLLDVVPIFNECGDDNREAVEAQLSVLAEGLTIAETSAEFDNDCTETYVLSAALTAAEWLWEGGEAPSVQWLHVVGKEVTVYSIN
jgi:hypothetical protein